MHRPTSAFTFIFRSSKSSLLRGENGPAIKSRRDSDALCTSTSRTVHSGSGSCGSFKQTKTFHLKRKLCIILQTFTTNAHTNIYINFINTVIHNIISFFCLYNAVQNPSILVKHLFIFNKNSLSGHSVCHFSVPEK